MIVLAMTYFGHGTYTMLYTTYQKSILDLFSSHCIRLLLDFSNLRSLGMIISSCSGLDINSFQKGSGGRGGNWGELWGKDEAVKGIDICR